MNREGDSIGGMPGGILAGMSRDGQHELTLG